jgi:iron complex outermembrane receptor protein
MIKQHKLKRANFKLTPVAAAILALSNPPVFAEESKALEEVVVTATKRQADLQDVAQSITAFTGADLERMGIKTMADYIRALPSVSMQATTPGRNQIVMRGISTGSDEYRTDSQVAVYLDEQPMTTNSQQVGVRAIDMERIESLPGPQGTLFGSSSQTGTMRLITNKPNHDGISGAVDAGFGSTRGGDESYDISGHVNVPLIQNTLAMRAVAYTNYEGGYVDNVLGASLSGNFDNGDIVDENINEYDVQGGRIAFLWNINDNWSSLFSLVGESSETDGSWETDPLLGDHKITRFVDESREDKWYSTAITLTGDLGFADLSMTATHFERDIAYEIDNNTYSQQKDRYFGGGQYYEAYLAGDPNYAAFNNIGLYDTGYNRSSIINDQSQERETLEIRLSSQGGSRLNWMVGGYYEDIQDEWFYYTQLPELTSTRAWATAQAYAAYYAASYPDSDILSPLPDSTIGYSNTMERTVKQIAFFGELSYDVTDKLSVTAGARWSEFERDEFDRFTFPQGLSAVGGHQDGGAFGDQGKSDDTIYKLGAQYQIDNDKMVYFLFSQGFRLGGVNSQRAANTGNVPRSYNPDYLDNYELGIKSQWLDNTLQLNASLFYMDWEDYQSEVFGVGAWWVRGTTNGNGAETKGAEINLAWQATQNMKIEGSLFLANAKFTADFADPNDPTTIQIAEGQPMPGSPDEKAWLSVTYDIPNVLGGDLWLYYDIAYRSETWNDTGHARDKDTSGLADSWTYSNFQMGLEMGNDLSVTLKVNNLFDQETYNWVSTSSNDDADIFGDQRFHNLRSLDRPRTMWLSLKKRF